METPGQIIKELERIRSQSEKGIELLAQAETKYLELEAAADKIENSELLKAQGTVVDRQAIAKLKNSRPVWKWSEIGIMKMPNDCLIPRQIIKIPIPSQTRIGNRKILIICSY